MPSTAAGTCGCGAGRCVAGPRSSPGRVVRGRGRARRPERGTGRARRARHRRRRSGVQRPDPPECLRRDALRFLAAVGREPDLPEGTMSTSESPRRWSDGGRLGAGCRAPRRARDASRPSSPAPRDRCRPARPRAQRTAARVRRAPRRSPAGCAKPPLTSCWRWNRALPNRISSRRASSDAESGSRRSSSSMRIRVGWARARIVSTPLSRRGDAVPGSGIPKDTTVLVACRTSALSSECQTCDSHLSTCLSTWGKRRSRPE